MNARPGMRIGLCIAATWCAAAGCESVPEANGSESLVILEQRDTGTTIGAATTHVESAGKRTYRVSGGEHDGAVVHRETTEADRFNAHWLTVESVVTADGPIPRRSEYSSIDDAGNAVLHATVDHDEQAITLFKPPLVTMPAEIEPGRTQTYESQARIVAEDDIRRQKERGAATQIITHAGSVRMRSAQGIVDAMKIVIEFEADLAMADALETTTRYITEDAGIIAIQRTRKVNILGMPGRESRETLQLVGTR